MGYSDDDVYDKMASPERGERHATEPYLYALSVRRKASMTQWALVTAGAQGLGGALSRHLLQRGYRVIVHYYTSAESAASLQREFGAERVLTVAADLATPAGRSMLIEVVLSHTERLHLLINNMGVYPEVSLLDTSLDLWDKTFALTCTAAFHLIQELYPHMRGAASRIINIGDSSIDRLEGHVYATPYYVAKYGLHVLTRSYAPLLAKHGILINMISPGWLENSVGPLNPELPAGRKGTFQDIIGALDYLLSDAASYVSGANLIVSGGFNLTHRSGGFDNEIAYP
jgi:NAD(P)-dependent dehydrogenase (short-subunit alcohol dehydrogenase family)